MFSRNKHLLLGAVAVVAIWLGVYLVFVRSNWDAATERLEAAEQVRAAWEKHLQPGQGLVSKADADKALEEHRNALSVNLQTLQKIEFGTRESLHPFTIPAAVGADPKSYLDQKRINIASHAEGMRLPVPGNLGVIGEKAGDDHVAVNLLRLAMVDTLINTCQKSGVARITRIQHYAPRLVCPPEDATALQEPAPQEEEPKPAAKKGAPAKTQAVAASRLVQFPMKVTFQAPERSLGKLLLELQKPSDSARGYLCLRGFHFAAKDTSSGLVDGAVAVSGLFSETLTRELGIQVKGEEEGRGPARKVDLNAW